MIIKIFFFLIIRIPSSSTLFPYTTLFRSESAWSCPSPSRRTRSPPGARGVHPRRSEEHTSELQSRRDLVCRLLLEKKNIFTYTLSLVIGYHFRHAIFFTYGVT